MQEKLSNINWPVGSAKFEVSRLLAFYEQIPFVVPRFLFKAAFHCLALYWILIVVIHPHGLSLYNIAISMLFVFSIVCFSIILVWYKKRATWSGFAHSDCYFLLLISIWFFIVIARGVELKADRLFTLVANPDIGGVVWLLPLAAFIGSREGVFGSLMYVARAHLVVGAVMTIYFISQPIVTEVVSPHPYDVALALMYGAPLILLLGVGSKADRYISYGALFLYIIGAFYLSRRAPCVGAILVFFISLCLGYKRLSKRVVWRAVFLTGFLLLVAPLAFNVIVASLPHDWYIDTRSFLFLEMKDNFSVWDWIIGRGALGTYYSPYFQHEAEAGRYGDWMIRQVNEIGYLHIVLKAGLIGVVLYLLSFTLVMRRAIKLEDSRFGVGVVAYFFIQIIEGFIIGRPQFIMENVAQWILIGFVLSMRVARDGEERKSYETRCFPNRNNSQSLSAPRR